MAGKYRVLFHSLRNTKDGANKFYQVICVTDTFSRTHKIFSSWGKIGTAGKMKESQFATEDQLLNFFNKTVSSKKSRGYENHDFKTLPIGDDLPVLLETCHIYKTSTLHDDILQAFGYVVNAAKPKRGRPVKPKVEVEITKSYVMVNDPEWGSW